MAKTKQRKKEDIKNLEAKFKEAKTIVFVDYKGLAVKEVEELRKNLRDNQIDYVVSKKSLANIAAEEAGYQDVDLKKLEGQLAIGFGQQEVLPAKLLYQFAVQHESLKLLAGLVDGKMVDQERITALAQLPTKEELLAKMVGSIKAPISGLLNVLQGNMRSLVYALKAIAESKS
ncbi:MAG: 50S ribosomal protein L10 [Patescibacteria group bacterium]